MLLNEVKVWDENKPTDTNCKLISGMHMLNKMGTKNLLTLSQKGLRITAETSTVSDGGISYAKHNDIICFCFFTCL